MPDTHLEILVKQDETPLGIPFWITHAADLQAQRQSAFLWSCSHAFDTAV